jgi:hypothetical protein
MCCSLTLALELLGWNANAPYPGCRRGDRRLIFQKSNIDQHAPSADAPGLSFTLDREKGRLDFRAMWGGSR